MVLVVVVIGTKLVAWLAEFSLEIVIFILVHLYLRHLLLIEHVRVDMTLVYI
jgi:hypothetical protein